MVWAKIVVATLPCLMCGCVAFYTKRPVEVVVTAKETGEPVANVPISVNYIYMMVLNGPRSVKGATDSNGRVVLPIADFDNGIIYFEAGEYKTGLSTATVRSGGELTRFHPTESADPAVTVRLTPMPRPPLYWIRERLRP